jgi:hypothetical protein
MQFFQKKVGKRTNSKKRYGPEKIETFCATYSFKLTSLSIEKKFISFLRPGVLGGIFGNLYQKPTPLSLDFDVYQNKIFLTVLLNIHSYAENWNIQTNFIFSENQ